jgi:hypothetical protein
VKGIRSSEPEKESTDQKQNATGTIPKANKRARFARTPRQKKINILLSFLVDITNGVPAHEIARATTH